MSWSGVLADFQATQSAAQAVGWADVVADCTKGIADVQALLTLTYDPRLVNLAPNSWLDLGLFTPTVPTGENLTETREGVPGNAGIVWDARRSRWVSFPGGHSGSNFNAVLSVSAVDLLYREDYPPTPATVMLYSNYDTPPTIVRNPDGTVKSSTANVGRGCWLAGPDGGPYPRPAARHTGQQLVVVGDTLRLLDLVEGNAPNTQEVLNGGGNGNYSFNCKAQIATYDFLAKTWSFENANPPQSDGDGGGALWGAALLDPIDNLVVWVNSAGFILYDPIAHTKKQWVKWQTVAGSKLFDEQGNQLTSGSVVQYFYTGSLVYDKAHDQYYFCSLHDDIWRFNYDRANPQNTTMTLLAATGPSPYLDYAVPASRPNAEHTHSWDNSGVITSGPFNSKFYAFDPATKAWSATTITTPVGSQASNSHFSCYSPDANRYLVLLDNNNQVTALKSHWVAYRYK